MTSSIFYWMTTVFVAVIDFFVNNESSVKHPSVCLAKCIGVHEANRKGTDNRQSSVIKGMLNTFIPHSRADAGPKLCSF